MDIIILPDTVYDVIPKNINIVSTNNNMYFVTYLVDEESFKYTNKKFIDLPIEILEYGKRVPFEETIAKFVTLCGPNIFENCDKFKQSFCVSVQYKNIIYDLYDWKGYSDIYISTTDYGKLYIKEFIIALNCFLKNIEPTKFKTKRYYSNCELPDLLPYYEF